MRRVMLAAGLAAAHSAPAPGVPLFAAYSGYPPCYRQPLIVALDAQRLVAFAEGRNNSFCSGAADGSNSSIHSRFSADGGATWSAPQELLHAPPMPDYLSAVATASGKVHLFVQTSPNLQLTSADGGATFSAPAPVKVALPKGYSATPGVASGIQLDGALCAEPTCGGHAGRLVVAWVCHAAKAAEGEAAAVAAAARLNDVSCAGCFSCLATSDDDGASWAIAPAAVSTQDGSREASLAQLASSAFGAAGAVVYASERNMGSAPGSRWHAISTDSGASFSLFGTDPSLPDGDTKNWTGICAGVARVGDTLVFSTPMAVGARADMGLFRSTDEGKTWSAGELFAAGPAGYSDLTRLNDTHAAIIYERGDDEFAQQINFAVIEA